MANVYVTNSMFVARCVAALKSADPALLTQCGIDASGVADGYLSKRFKLPLIAPFDTGLVLKVFDIMQFLVAGQIGFRPQSGQNELLETKNTAAYSWLRDVSRGDAELPNQIDSSPTIDEEGSLATSGVRVDFAMTTGVRGRCGSCGGFPCVCGGWP